MPRARMRTGLNPRTVALVSADEPFRRATIASDANVRGVANDRESRWSVERECYYYRTPKTLPERWSRLIGEVCLAIDCPVTWCANAT